MKHDGLPREEAAMSYDPDDDGDGTGERGNARRALAAAEERFLGRPGVTGVGLGAAADGRRAVVVYLRTAAAKAGIPRTLLGVPVTFEVTGTIGPLGGN